MTATPVAGDLSTETLVIKNATVYDGTGYPPFAGAVAVRGDSIVGVGRRLDIDGARELDVSGLTVAPGIIDLHTHSDVSLLSDPDCVSAIRQGITTQVVGHCGFSAAPTNRSTRRSLVAEEPVFGFPPGDGFPSGEWGWDSIEDYLDVVRAAAPRTNVATLVGHNTLRRLVVGSDDHPVGAAQIDRMRGLVASALQQGALGFSTGLSYAPGLFAGIEEIAAVASVAGAHGRRYHTHMRYGDLSTRESLAEAIDTARRSETPLNVSHLYPGRGDGPDEAARLLEMVESARRDGLDVTFDLTLFPRGGGTWIQSLPAWAQEGGLAAIVRRLRDAEFRRRLLDAIGRSSSTRDWDDDLIVKINRPENAGFIGRSIGAIARERGIAPEEAALALVEEDGQFWIAPTIKRQADLDLLLSHPACVPVTDGMAAHPVRHAALGLMPKTFGTFPHLFGSYVRERGILTLADAIARVTSLAAQRLGLADRGRLEEGKKADLMVFDPDSVSNRATDHEPGLAPSGISAVMVNGVWALSEGVLTPGRSGRAIT